MAIHLCYYFSHRFRSLNQSQPTVQVCICGVSLKSKTPTYATLGALVRILSISSLSLSRVLDPDQYAFPVSHIFYIVFEPPLYYGQSANEILNYELPSTCQLQIKYFLYLSRDFYVSALDVVYLSSLFFLGSALLNCIGCVLSLSRCWYGEPYVFGLPLRYI